MGVDQSEPRGEAESADISHEPPKVTQHARKMARSSHPVQIVKPHSVNVVEDTERRRG